MSWLRLVIFDCDGVLVDSEGVSARVLRDTAAENGVEFSDTAAHEFMGRRWSDLQADFEILCGTKFGAGWPLVMQEKLLAMMRRDGLPLCPGAREAIEVVRNLGLPYRIASNSSRAEMAGKFALSGLLPLVDGRYHSSGDGGRGKPAPDVYLAAAAAENIAPKNCLAIEDSVPGVTAAIAAGMRCLGYAHGEDAAKLASLGARPIASLFEIPAILRAALQDTAA